MESIFIELAKIINALEKQAYLEKSEDAKRYIRYIENDIVKSFENTYHVFDATKFMKICIKGYKKYGKDEENCSCCCHTTTECFGIGFHKCIHCNK